MSTSCFYSSVVRPNAFFHPVLHTDPPLILPGALVPFLGLSCFPHSCVQPLTHGLREAQVSCEHNSSENYRFTENVRAFLFCRFSVVTQLCVGDDLVLSRRQQAGHPVSLPSVSGVLSEGEMGRVLLCHFQSGQAVAVVLLLNV